MASSQKVEVSTFALEQRKKLHKVLGRWDLILLSVSAVIGVDTIAYSAQTGYQIITWIFLSAILFLLPYGLITAELAATYPKEGGLYFWVRSAFGPYIGAISSFVYWISNPIWMGSLALTAVGTLSAALGLGLSTGSAMLLAIAVVWLVTALEILYLNAGKWLPNLGGVIKWLLLTVLGAGAIVIATSHGNANPMHFSAFVPTGVTTLALMPVLIFNWVGFEVQSSASEEMKNPRRDVPRSILVSGFAGAIAYGLGILGILLVTPEKNLSTVTGLFGAFQEVLRNHGLLVLVGILIFIGYLSSGTAWLLGVDRSFATSGWDRSIPRFFGHFHSHYGTPDRVAIMSGAVPTIFILINYFTYHSASLSGVYNNLLNAAFVAALFPYIFMLPSVLVLRRKHPDLPRPFQVPGGKPGVWVAFVLSWGFALLAVVMNFVPEKATGVTPQGAMQMGWYLLAELVVASLLFLWARREKGDSVQMSMDELLEGGARKIG